MPVIRKADQGNIAPITETLVKGGIKAIEIIGETPRVGALIQKLTGNLGDQLIVGTGTIRI